LQNGQHVRASAPALSISALSVAQSTGGAESDAESCALLSLAPPSEPPSKPLATVPPQAADADATDANRAVAKTANEVRICMPPLEQGCMNASIDALRHRFGSNGRVASRRHYDVRSMAHISH
jgi:hypothetical protein